MPVVGTKAAASSQGFGEFTKVSGPATYIEDVFSTYVYTGTGGNQTFNNGVDLSTNGGMVWIKQRSSPADDWRCVDSARGITNGLQQNLNNAQQDWTGLGYVTSFNTNGFSIGVNVSINTSAYTYASWTFRKQPKFFDVVTYTGNGANGRSISHSLASTPGLIIIKRTDALSNWSVGYCPESRWTGESYTGMYLNTTAAVGTTTANGQGISSISSTAFTVIESGSNPLEFNPNVNGATYVAYLFAHNAGGFGLTGTDNVISCGSFTTDGSGNATVTLGYEPQWVLMKQTNLSGNNWTIVDNMRGFPATVNNQYPLYPNTSDAETLNSTNDILPTATGFVAGSSYLGATNTYIYIAIRRGPMKTPTSGTSVFAPVAVASSGSINYDSQSYYFDLGVIQNKDGTYGATWSDRLRGLGVANVSGTITTNATALTSSSTSAETTSGYLVQSASGGYVSPSSAGNRVFWMLRRAPGFFDEVCYTGNGPGTQVISHNLGVAPELSIFKSRSVTGGWTVYYGATQFLRLNETTAGATDGNISPTATSVTVSSSLGFGFNASGVTYVAYFFASCPNVSKVGSYTGTGATQTISCGFAARFVLIKRTDSTGDWFVWDTARGMVAGTDPRLALNSTAAETNANWVYTNASGFQIVTTDATVNASGGTYIYLAIA